MTATIIEIEFAKSRAMRVIRASVVKVPTCQRPNVPIIVSTHLTCQRRANYSTWRPNVPTCQKRANFSIWRVNVFNYAELLQISRIFGQL